MKPFVLALRAIGAEFATRLFIPVVSIAAIIMALVAGGIWWLTTLSQWWWLLFIPVTSLFCILVGVGFVVFSLIRYIRPPQTNTQKKAVKQFVNRLQTIAEVTGTPKFIVLYRVVQSIAAPSKDAYLFDLIENRTLITEFTELQRSFHR